MNNVVGRYVTVGALVLCMTGTAGGADIGRVLRSTAFPGMGQLGDNQVGRGLLYMGGEVVLLSLAVDRIVSKAALDRSTEYLQEKMEQAEKYEEKEKYRQEWQDAYDESERDALLSYVFGGCAAVWWAWNIVDAVVFAPKEESALLRTIKSNTRVCIGVDRAEVTYRVPF